MEASIPTTKRKAEKTSSPMDIWDVWIGIAEGGARTRDLEVVLYLRATRSTD